MHIGVYPWPNSQNIHILPQPLKQHMNQKRYYHLNQLAFLLTSNMWKQGWREVINLEILENLMEVWYAYTNSLKTSHIRLTDSPDELIWAHASHGQYTPKLGYHHISSTYQEGDLPWWRKSI